MMKRLFALPQLAGPRRTAVAFSLICALLTLIIAFDLWPGASGTFFASNAMAQAEAQAPAAKAPAPAQAESEQNKGTETQTQAAAESFHSVFQTDPLQSLSDSLRRKEAELQAREAAVAQKEQYLETLRLETQETLKKIEQVRTQMEAIASAADQERVKQVKKWVDIFQKMQPDKVAPVLSGLDQDLQLELFNLMDPAKAAKVLSAFPPDIAAKLSATLKQ